VLRRLLGPAAFLVAIASVIALVLWVGGWA
jgi:hypothetical protein